MAEHPAGHSRGSSASAREAAPQRFLRSHRPSNPKKMRSREKANSTLASWHLFIPLWAARNLPRPYEPAGLLLPRQQRRRRFVPTSPRVKHIALRSAKAASASGWGDAPE